MLSHFHFPQYFSSEIKKEIGELYASSAIANMALSIVMLFEPIFLYVALGFTVQQILWFMALVYLVYVVFIPWGGKVASLYGYKHAIAMSIPFQILYWSMLLAARDTHAIVLVAAVAFGLQKSLYWPGFHALMARYANQQQMGREFGVVYAITSISHILGPLLGGLLAQSFGFVGAFITASVIYCCSIIPLFREKEMFIPKEYAFRQTIGLYKSMPRKFVGYMGFGEELLVLTIWPIVMYNILQNYRDTGTVATIASLFAALLALMIGKISDQYTKKVLIKLGAFFTALVWIARVAASTAGSIFAIDSLSRTSRELTAIPLATHMYLKAEETHVVPYVVFFEQSLAIGKLLACILGIILFSLTGSFVVLFILAALFSLLYMRI
jgi:MFS family permease